MSPVTRHRLGSPVCVTIIKQRMRTNKMAVPQAESAKVFLLLHQYLRSNDVFRSGDTKVIMPMCFMEGDC